MNRTDVVGDILVVDDNVDNIHLLDRLLSERGHRVRAATDGAAALSIIERYPPEVVLLDVCMPGIDGHAVCERLKSDDTRAEIPVIFLSALQDAAEKVRAFRTGAVDYLTKPFEAEELLGRVSTHLKLHRLHAELRRQSDNARRASEAKSRFIAAASHDLRQPLDTMRLFIEALNGELDARPDIERLREISAKLRSTLGNMEVLFDSILDITRIDANAVVPRREDVAVARLFEALERDVAPRVADRGLEWRCECTDSHVRSDPVLLERVLRNLLDNAVKYTRAGSVGLYATESDGELEISVVDTGEGIAEEDRALIFEEFYKIDKGVRGSHRGIGLGLSIVKRLCRLLEHPLSVESSVGGGTRIRIRAKLAPTPSERGLDAERVLPSGVVEADARGERAARVLLIDDPLHAEDVDGARIRSHLDAWGHRIVPAPPARSGSVTTDDVERADLIIVSSCDVDRLDRYLERLHARPGSSAPQDDVPIVAVGPAFELLTGGDRRYPGRVLRLDTPIRPARLRSTLRACLRRSRSTGPSS